ncbi:arginine--tRNA ligase [Ginsengibacter hankyongi]|uniref:Arginine--tRNA ligase n=1 Tax=Ginsengibacter hankyongi TaxID=2607284 RepID=A0A5J5IHY6_9BACT|nr:arginine--tRNA ligase [Ginsengibacter hankyongi]KAA9040496.1 arginine--tRNA ligase [Ginsengibacter hankyongi]
MAFTHLIQAAVVKSLKELYGQEFSEKDFQINETKPEFEGDYSIVLFALVKKLKSAPEVLAKNLGENLIKNNPDFFSDYNVIKAFLNLNISEQALQLFLTKNYHDTSFGRKPLNHKKVMVEYSSPNTNKPLHLGHLRNNFLGWSVAEILKANGNEVYKSSIVNDRGIHICKSMIAWQEFANGATPETVHEKGDHFVGDYYVKFNNEYKREVKELTDRGLDEKAAEKEAPIMKKTQQMLLDWEQGKPDVIDLWNKMNGWVYKGFDETYKRIGSDFDQTFYESQTYILGKEFVQKGLEDGSFYKKEDGSVWIDLSDVGLDEKLLLRGDGTSVYITQDIGLVKQKFEEYKLDESIYVIGDEQIYHMKVLKEICRKLGMPFANNILHLSYGMVELTTGKMKSREGTVVDADDLIDEMIATSKLHTEELGKVKDFTEDELNHLYETLGMGAMKFYLLRVDPKKRMIFNPEESIDFHGFTGPFIQYTYARIQSIIRKIGEPIVNEELKINNEKLFLLERQLIIFLEKYSNVLEQAADELNPSLIANYAFHLAKTFNSFYVEHSVANAESEEKKNLRLRISVMTAIVIKSALQLLGIKVPERM